MFHTEDKTIQAHLFDAEFGLEMECLRIHADGTFAHTKHPFPGDKNIVRDFCENQTEINTGVHHSAGEALNELQKHKTRIREKLLEQDPPEYLWPFSNPPYIADENDIPVAVFNGEQILKTEYRKYLSDKYGRYKMTFSGIHVNFSFSDELILRNFMLDHPGEPAESACESGRFQHYKDELYLDLAEKMMQYGWILTAITAASPVLDSSYMEHGVYDRDIFTGMASVRCSELGYWNTFPPVLDYGSIEAYAYSIQKYVDSGLLRAPSELYYPVRIKPAGENNLESLKEHGVNHIELRMFDLNPMAEAGVDQRDLEFAGLLMVYLASLPRKTDCSEKGQIQSVQNFKNAAHFDLDTVKIKSEDGTCRTMNKAAQEIISEMKDFCAGIETAQSRDITEVLDFQEAKFSAPETRYANQVREMFGDGFVRSGLEFVLNQKRQ
ncbi:MAG: hypothetical protein PUA82_07075 [Eubacteriales bacterium]|nr:hypothetical protein [Eubacteriales bacterium]